MRKLPLLAAIVVGLMLGQARAAAPSQGSYAASLGIGPYGAATFVPGSVLMWINSLATGVNAFGLPTPVGDQAPLPVQIMGGGYTGQAIVVPPVTTTAYGAGQVVAGTVTLPGLVRSGQTSGLIQKVLIGFADAQTPTLDMFVLNAAPTSSTTTNGSAFALAAADISKVIGVVHVSDCSAAGTPTICQAQQLAMSYAGASPGGSLYGVLVTRAAITLGSTSDVTVTIAGPQD